MAWGAWTGVGGSGDTTGSVTLDFNSAGAPGANKRYVITNFELDWNNNGAYIYDAGTNTFTIKLVCGSTTVTVGTYSRSANGARPTISWSGSVLCPVNTKIQFVQTRNGGSAGIKNWYQVRVGFNTLTRPTVSAGTTIQKTQMDALRTWKNGGGTAVTQGAVATAAHGNTYKSGLTAGTTTFDDAWYNSVT